MGARKRLPVGRRPVRRTHMQDGSAGRTPRGVAVVARERLPVGRVDVHQGGGGRAPWRATDCPWDWHTYVHKPMDGKLRNWAVANGCPQR